MQAPNADTLNTQIPNAVVAGPLCEVDWEVYSQSSVMAAAPIKLTLDEYDYIYHVVRVDGCTHRFGSNTDPVGIVFQLFDRKDVP